MTGSAKQSRKVATWKDWIASSLALLAMTMLLPNLGRPRRGDPAVLGAIGEIDRKPDREPQGEPHPGIERQPQHQKQRGQGAERRDDPDRGRPERPRQLRVQDAQCQRAG